jgi:hypothetical protein
MNINGRTDWHCIAEELWATGLTVFPIDESVVEPARTGFKSFLTRRQEKDDGRNWSIQRGGENEYDIGLVQRNGDGHDVKSFFHHDHTLKQRLLNAGQFTDEADTQFLLQNLALLKHVNEVGRLLTRALDTCFHLNCAKQYELCQRSTLPYSTTTLRGLHYADGPNQTGAQSHFDRSFVTIHLGDQGGTLQTQTVDEQWVDISPPPGFALAFFGLKARWVTNDRKGPLRHRSITIPGRDRFAFVHFGHVPVKSHYVQDAAQSNEAFEVMFLPAIKDGTYHWQ